MKLGCQAKISTDLIGTGIRGHTARSSKVLIIELDTLAPNFILCILSTFSFLDYSFSVF